MQLTINDNAAVGIINQIQCHQIINRRSAEKVIPLNSKHMLMLKLIIHFGVIIEIIGSVNAFCRCML
ncbi:MAG: hypothetical protein A2Z14_11120 [Chloroflexi bacterium RBG_16_48_8]|nr:MAG: hypothetical protein A2Z14_11120 [Chloroflexi bacterium RBG_16_48_8]